MPRANLLLLTCHLVVEEPGAAAGAVVPAPADDVVQRGADGELLEQRRVPQPEVAPHGVPPWKQRTGWQYFINLGPKVGAILELIFLSPQYNYPSCVYRGKRRKTEVVASMVLCSGP